MITLCGLQYKTLIRLAKKHCKKSDEPKPVLTGIMVEIRNNEAQLAACDGYRAIRFTVPSEPDDQVDSFTMPILEMKCADDDLITIAREDNKVHVFNNKTQVEQIAPIIDGDHISFNEIIQEAAEREGNVVHLNTKFAEDAFVGLSRMLAEYSTNSLVKMVVPASGVHPIYITSTAGDLKYDSLLLPVRMYDQDK